MGSLWDERTFSVSTQMDQTTSQDLWDGYKGLGIQVGVLDRQKAVDNAGGGSPQMCRCL